MLECCSACNGVIWEAQGKVKCAGPCGELFHESCAKTKGHMETRGVLQYVNSADSVKSDVSRRLEMNPTDSYSQPVTLEILNRAIDSFREDIMKELHSSIEKLKGSDTANKKKTNSDEDEMKKELNELRIENEVLRDENAALLNRVQILESKVNSDDKTLNDVKKLLRSLSKRIDQNSEFVEEIKEELRQVQVLNDTLDNANDGLVRQVNELNNKVNDLQGSIRTITEKINNTSAAAASRSSQSVGESPRLDLALPPSGLDHRIVPVGRVVFGPVVPHMVSATQKHINFVVEHMANKPVTALAGIGPVLGGRLNSHGYLTASQVYQQFLALNKNKGLFQSWLKAICNANVKQSGDCYQCLYSYDYTRATASTDIGQLEDGYWRNAMIDYLRTTAG